MKLVVGQPLKVNFINSTGVVSTVDVAWNGRSCRIGEEIVYVVERTSPLSDDYKSKYPNAKESYSLSGKYIKANQPEWQEELTAGEYVTI